MGSIVTSIGKAIKGIGKALKKILPALLLAAAIYVGYGYMTGFQSGGWPQIMNWGKSLISGITQGETISAATAAADATAGTVATAVEATALPAVEAIEATALPTGDIAQTVMGAAGGEALPAVGEVAETVAQAGEGINWGDWVNKISDETTNWAKDVLGTTYTDISKGIINSNVFNPMSDAKAGLPLGSLFSRGTGDGADQAALNLTALTSVTDGAGFPGVAGDIADQSPAIPIAPGRALAESLTSAADLGGPHFEDETFPAKLAALGKKAWSIYKNMWADNPGMAMWTTSNVLKTILALLDDSAEKESYRRRHVAGFAPGGWDEVAKRYGGNLPGGRGGGAGYSTAGRRSMELKTGPLPEANRSRTSAIDRRPAGIIGSSTQRTV